MSVFPEGKKSPDPTDAARHIVRQLVGLVEEKASLQRPDVRAVNEDGRPFSLCEPPVLLLQAEKTRSMEEIERESEMLKENFRTIAENMRRTPKHARALLPVLLEGEKNWRMVLQKIRPPQAPSPLPETAADVRIVRSHEMFRLFHRLVDVLCDCLPELTRTPQYKNRFRTPSSFFPPAGARPASPPFLRAVGTSHFPARRPAR